MSLFKRRLREARQLAAYAGGIVQLLLWGAAAFMAVFALFAAPSGAPILSWEVLVWFIPAVVLFVVGPIAGSWVERRLSRGS
jgi:hypothetical protein